MSELRNREEISQWLTAGLCLVRTGAAVPATLEASTPWLLAALGELPALPPVGIVADLGRLVTGGELTASVVPAAEPRLRAAVRAYEDQVLGRLGADPRLEAATDAITRLEGRLRPTAVALLVGDLLERLGLVGTAVSPATARKIMRRPAADLLREGFAELRQPTLVTARLTEQYEQLVHAARGARALLGDREIFTLEHLDVLGSLARRVAVAQIVEAAEALEQALPRRMKRGPQQPRGMVQTHLEDESVYPIGGFASLSNSGSLENLVTSELIYMEETAGEEVDLFDLRYVESELLYYTRDESLHVRRRHVLTFVLPGELEAARFKDPALRWQRLVLAQGLILCAVRRLADWLSDEGLFFRVVFLPGTLAEEQEIMALLLREWSDRGMAEVVTAPDLDAVLVDATARARSALSDVLVLGMGSFQGVLDQAVLKKIRLATLRLDQPQPKFAWWHGGRPVEDETPWQAWVGAALGLLQGIV